MSMSSKLAFFAGGALFGSVGIKLLTTEEAKNTYVVLAAAGLRAKDCVMQTVTAVQESTSDILAAARDLNEERAARALEKQAEAEIIDDADLIDEAEIIAEEE